MGYDYSKKTSQKGLSKRDSGNGAAPVKEGFDFGNNAPAASMQMNTALMSPEVAREVATVQAQVVMAKMYPRNLADAIKRIQGECSRKVLAEKAMYVFKRGTGEISGPSIRLAESIARNYGNIKYGFEVQSSSETESKVRSYCYDLETNVSAERVFKVNHILDTKYGPKILTDQRDIYEHVANQSIRRERACILEVIPGDIVDFAQEECMKTLKSTVTVDSNSILAIVNAFANYGVSQVQLEAYLDRDINSIAAQQLLHLRQIYMGIKDGMSKPEEIFLSEEEAREERKGKSKPVTAAPAPEENPAPAEEPMDYVDAGPEPDYAPDEADDEPVEDL